MRILRSFKSLVILIGLFSIPCTAVSETSAPNMVGTWDVTITFQSGEKRSVRFVGRESGKGSFQLLGAGAKVWGVSESSEANWTQAEGETVMISGPIQFPLGNVAVDRGTLRLKGKIGTAGVMTGEASFFSLGADPGAAKASKRGSFEAVRVTKE